jgi:uncharacterized membrane protein
MAGVRADGILFLPLVMGRLLRLGTFFLLVTGVGVGWRRRRRRLVRMQWFLWPSVLEALGVCALNVVIVASGS